MPFIDSPGAGSEAPPSIEPKPDGPPPRRRRRRVPLVVASTVVGVLLLAFVLSIVVRLPYTLVEPGSATPVGRAVHVNGATTYDHNGRLLYLTVSVRGSPNDKPTAFRVFEGWLDDDVDVVPQDELFQGRTSKQDEQLNALEMRNSQLAAKKVALERLGYPVPVTGNGVIVLRVQRHSPADGKLEGGDVITGIDGKGVTLGSELGPAVRAHAPGASLALTVERSGKTRSVTIQTRAAPNGPYKGMAQIGVTADTRDLHFDFPVDVKIDTGKVGGPSAGLAFTLQILDELTPGDLTGGRRVAVTGAIDLDGSVQPVGGVTQKAVSARRAGARLFLVPTQEAAEARAHGGKRMKVVPVKDLAAALSALQAAGGDPLPAR